jgi:cytochrome c oxidase subunit 2
VYLALTSTDVIHSFWVPALAGKMDMVPGRMTGLALRPSRPGVYRGQCAEYCGLQHARMALHVVVEPPAAFNAWLANEARPQPFLSARASAGNADAGGSAASGEARARLALGRSAFEQHCAACHAVRTAAGRLGPGPGPESEPAPARAKLPGAGPDLTHVASRMYLAAGTLRNEPGALAAWISDPHVHKPGVRMPAAAGMDPAKLQALAAYLEQLK